MINIIVAIGQNGLIGKDNDLPWHYKEDLQYFKETTLNKTVLMGDATFYSILSRNHKILPHRKNVVATLDPNFKYENVDVVHDLISYLKTVKEDIYIIGGKQIYTLSLPYADRLYITHVNHPYEGNVFFPEIDYTKYNKIQEKVSGDLSFCIYERIKK